MRQTGGLAVGAISTKSKSASNARCCASPRGTIPACSPSASIKRTSCAVICSLIDVLFLLSFGDCLGPAMSNYSYSYNNY